VEATKRAVTSDDQCVGLEVSLNGRL
jgi:hypothetical protein